MIPSEGLRRRVKRKIHPKIWRLASSNYFRAVIYPMVLLILLITLSAAGISGTSMGAYHKNFYGIESTDKNLLANSPRDIRSDEWVVGTQKIIAQDANDYKTTNQNVGNGEDVIVLTDVPANDWSTVFRPQNIGFFVLPFDNAFSLRWWMPVFLLATAVYVLAFTLLPKRYLLSALISICAAASPFLHWWYGYSTFAILAFIFFGTTAIIRLLRSSQRKNILVYTGVIVYSGVAFILSFYPPFQIPVFLVAAIFVIGYCIEYRKEIIKNHIKLKLLAIGLALAVAVGLSGLFFFQHKSALEAVSTTAYPGERIVTSGKYSFTHLLSSPYSSIFQNNDRAGFYQKPSIGAINQSESSNFLLVMPLLIPVMVCLIISRGRQKKPSWLLISTLVAFLLFLVWMFIPNLSIIGKITLLDKVPHPRLLIGWGAMNIIMMIVFIRYTSGQKKSFSNKQAAAYATLLYILYLLVGWKVNQQFPEFIGIKSILVYGAVFPVIIFLFMRRHNAIALSILAAFSLSAIVGINPLYKGLDVVTETPLVKKIESINDKHPATWVSDYIAIENFPAMAGARGLTGTFVVPQNSLWDGLGLTEQRKSYNRYAHVSYTYDRSPGTDTPTRIIQNTEDQFNIFIEPCSSFYRTEGVRYLVTTVKFSYAEAPCAKLIDVVKYPVISFYIYQLDT